MTGGETAGETGVRLARLAEEFGEPLTCDRLTQTFSIVQRRRGHRHSTDDLLTAWYATVHGRPGPVRTTIDLGSGIGSVGLCVAWVLRAARLTAIEVQETSFRLLRENVALNGVEGRTTLIHGDLRYDLEHLEPASFDLVTGSPPYFDVKAGIVSADPQRAGARFELRGDVSDYCRAAARLVSPEGRFVFCFPTAQRARAQGAVVASKLAILAQCDVVPRVGLAPLFTLFACARSGTDGPPRTVVEPPLIVRDAAGAHTEEMLLVRAVFGMGARAGARDPDEHA